MIGAELTARLRERGIERNTIEQAKQRLKRDRGLIAFDGKVWRLTRYATAETSPQDAQQSEADVRERATATS